MKGAIVAVVLFVVVQLCHGRTSPLEDEVLLELFCRGIYVLPCPDTTEVGDRAGRLRFYNVPKSNCSVKVTTPSNCKSKSAIYLHVPVSYLGDSQTVRIYERIDGKSTLVKQIPGGKSHNMPNNAIESIAQLISSYQKVPSLTINMDLGPPGKNSSYNEIIFDYTILTQKPKPGEVLCQSLKGYVPRSILCDHTDRMRVSCPDAYMQRTDPNSVMGMQSCDTEETPIEVVDDPTTAAPTMEDPTTVPTTITKPSFTRSRKTQSPSTRPHGPATPTTTKSRTRIWINDEPQEVQHVDFGRNKGYGTVGFVLQPLPPDQTAYRIVLGTLVLYVGDRDVYLGKEGEHNYEEQIFRSPAHSLIHPNCSQLIHWISFSSRNAGTIAPFIKFGYGYQVTNNTLFHFVSKTNGTHDPVISGIGKVTIADQVSIVDKLKYQREPVLRDTAPVIITPDKRSMEHIMATDVKYMQVARNPLIAGVLEDVNAFTLTQEQLDAINYSLETPGCTLANILARKTTFGSKQSSYIRIPGPANLDAPGQEMVLEIWPPGHFSPVHNHGNATAVIRVLQGSIKSEWYNPIVNISYEKPVLLRSEMFYTGNITWMKSDMYQTHKLHNVDTKTAAITIQAYRYEEDDDVVKEDYFYYIKPDSPYLGQFFPSVDLTIDEILKPEGKIIHEFKSRQCQS